MNEPRRTDGTEPGGGGHGRRGANRLTRRQFLAYGAAAGLGAFGLAAGGSLAAAPSDPAAPAKGETGPGGPKRTFTYRGKKVDIVEDARGADLVVDGKRVRAKKVSGMYRAPGFAFVMAHTPDEVAKKMIDYRLDLEAKAAGKKPAAGGAGAHHAGGH